MRLCPDQSKSMTDAIVWCRCLYICSVVCTDEGGTFRSSLPSGIWKLLPWMNQNCCRVTFFFPLLMSFDFPMMSGREAPSLKAGFQTHQQAQLSPLTQMIPINQINQELL